MDGPAGTEPLKPVRRPTAVFFGSFGRNVKRLGAAGLVVVAGCATSQRPAPPPEGPRPFAQRSQREASSPRENAGATDGDRQLPGDAQRPGPTPDGVSCGSLGCRLFETPRAAFRYVLEQTDPQVLAIGEAHAQRGTEGIAPAVRRFAEELLPELSGRATDLVVELMLPPSGCDEPAKDVGQRQKEVTERQAEGTQNEYVVLGRRARALGIVPDALRPSCDDLRRISAAGDDAVIEMLVTITRLTERALLDRFEQNEDAGRAGMVVAYGGAMHNDRTPRSGREAFSFGPDLAERLGRGYVELDLIVPELIKDSPSWRSLPWVSLFDPGAHPRSTTLYEPHPQSYVLIFPARADSARR